jgi:hypothetical protein
MHSYYHLGPLVRSYFFVGYLSGFYTLQETSERSSVITDEHTFITDEYTLYSSINR